MKMNRRDNYCRGDYQSPVGISLISLIITIIVIIILAAIVIFTGLSTPDRANFAKFTSEFSDFDTAVQTDYANKYAEHALKNETRSKAQIYYEIANGGNIDMNDEPEAVGEVQSLGLDLKGGEILGTEYYEITNDTNVDKWNRDKFYYEPEERHFVTDAGTVFTMPGYLMEENGEQRWYVNSKTYYVGEKKVISGGKSKEPVPLTDIYVTLYDDGILCFNNDNKKRTGIGIVEEFGDISKNSYSMYSTELGYQTNAPWYPYQEQITQVTIENKIVPSNMEMWFTYLTKVTKFNNLSNIDTSNVTQMNNLFNGCYELTSVDVSSFDTSNVTSMLAMFSECKKLLSLDLSNWDTSNVKTFYCMFYQCQALMSINCSLFDTSNATNMYCMFYDCENLQHLDVSSFNTKNVTNMSYMFGDCQKLTDIDVSSFDTSSVNDMSGMFRQCELLSTLDLSSFNTKNVTNMNNMFHFCKKLNMIYVTEDFDTSLVTNSNNMLTCSSLVGGNGTKVKDIKVYDKTYARIDKEGQKGYFTDIKDKI